MRFIVRQQPGHSPMLVPFVDAIMVYGRVDHVNFLDAYAIEVSEGRLGAWQEDIPRLQREYNITIRPAAILRAIAPVDPDPIPQVPNSLAKLDLTQLWAEKVTGRGVTIGVIERGFSSHDSLVKCVRSHKHYDPVTRRVEDGAIVGNSEVHHGTFAAALIAGSPIDGIQICVAPDAQLDLVEMPAVSFEDDLALTIDFLATERRCKVISISLGSWEPMFDYELTLQKARDAGALTVAAIGNEYKGVARWPAACSRALSVGFCDEDAVLMPNSSSTHFERNLNPLVPLVLAPGVMLVSAKVGGKWTNRSGSSFSTPLIAGMAGLLASECDMATPNQIEEAIIKSCVRLPEYDERCAHGLPSAKAALDYLRMLTSC